MPFKLLPFTDKESRDAVRKSHFPRVTEAVIKEPEDSRVLPIISSVFPVEKETEKPSIGLLFY